jgi:hypothetical protein
MRVMPVELALIKGEVGGPSQPRSAYFFSKPPGVVSKPRPTIHPTLIGVHRTKGVATPSAVRYSSGAARARNTFGVAAKYPHLQSKVQQMFSKEWLRF